VAKERPTLFFSWTPENPVTSDTSSAVIRVFEENFIVWECYQYSSFDACQNETMKQEKVIRGDKDMQQAKINNYI
jgi:hypothetical protein